MKSTHSLERTSPKGGPFLGTCVKCGRKNLPGGAALEECDNPRGTIPEQDILEAIDRPSPTGRED